MIIMMTETNFEEIEYLLNIEYIRSKPSDSYLTVRDYYQCLNDKIANEFFAEVLKQGKSFNTPVSSMSAALNIIRWARTKQGQEYWLNIHRAVAHKLKFNSKDFKTINIIEEDGEY